MEKDILKNLKECDLNDKEIAHVECDKVLWQIAEKHEPELFKEMQKIVKDIDFWYA